MFTNERNAKTYGCSPCGCDARLARLNPPDIAVVGAIIEPPTAETMALINHFEVNVHCSRLSHLFVYVLVRDRLSCLPSSKLGIVPYFLSVGICSYECTLYIIILLRLHVMINQLCSHDANELTACHYHNVYWLFSACNWYGHLMRR